MSATTAPSSWDAFISSWRGTAEFIYFLAGILLLVGIVLAYTTYRAAKTTARQRNTLDKIAGYREPLIEGKIHRAIALIRQGAFAGDALLSSLQPIDQRAVVFVLNEWDELALYVRYGVLDEQLLFDNYSSLALEIWTHLRSVVQAKRKTDPRSWLAFDWLAVRWMIRATSKASQERDDLLKETQDKLDRLLRL